MANIANIMTTLQNNRIFLSSRFSHAAFFSGLEKARLDDLTDKFIMYYKNYRREGYTIIESSLGAQDDLKYRKEIS